VVLVPIVQLPLTEQKKKGRYGTDDDLNAWQKLSMNTRRSNIQEGQEAPPPDLESDLGRNYQRLVFTAYRTFFEGAGAYRFGP